MELKINSKSRVDLIDITDSVEKNLKVKEGMIVLYTPHTTTGLYINENESELVKDVEKLLNQLAPQGKWGHDYQEGNADAHLRGILLGNSVTIPVEKGKLSLGTWQRIMFYEGDGPRNRRIILKELED